jgi:tRNA threonylcarbamoyladenosine biosynthesis protein TsaB
MNGERDVTIAMDCSTSFGSVAIGLNGQVAAETTVQFRAGSSSALLPAVDFALGMAGYTAASVGRVVVGSGPGSFTGLRIAGATAKGLVHALDVPLYAYSSLLAAAVPFLREGGEPVGALFDARGQDVFMACYQLRNELLIAVPPVACTLAEAIEALRNARAAVLVGDGAARHARELEAETGARPVPAPFGGPAAGSLLWLAGRFPTLGRVAAPHAWQPDYLRASGAERMATDRAISTISS